MEFYREDLNFVLNTEKFIVSGIYYFRNETDRDIKRTLFYPFPNDTLYEEVTDFSSICLQDSLDVTTKISKKGAYFRISLQAGKEANYFISYQQNLLGNKAEYILRTTKTWGKPFKEVNYTLKFPMEFTIDSLSYIPDSLKTLENKYELYYHYEDFMPDRDFLIKFESDSKKEKIRKP